MLFKPSALQIALIVSLGVHAALFTVRFTCSIGKMSSRKPLSTSTGRGAIRPARSLSSPSVSRPGTKLHVQWKIERMLCLQSQK